ncbi:YihY/virulence factor BrkB family protein [Allosphingosinicella flava]|uniref:YihY/virulence factor BrkB family protein n=1 Tax=Allosphingosinicella flava TaxID=2771430 RepID=A0A7T2LLA1_9SPHN|nr:YihY/virulence factor BrkB family protein [Sphingosinicella flava]QPQ54219.1 YihY/virulence factor BrkB family protein [Sphingosinicella flava]
MTDQHDESGRGREADKPTQIPARGWKDIVVRAWKESGQDNMSLVSAGVAFYAFLAMVPLLAAFVLSYGLFAAPATMMGHVRGLFQVLPRDAAAIIGEQLVSVTSQAASKTGLGLLFALGLALYGAMKGAAAMITALNIAYDEDETRGFIRKTLAALAITIGAVVTGLVAVAAIGALAAVDRLLPGAPPLLPTLIRIGFWIAAAAVASGAVAALYRYAPDREAAKWRWLTPGSIVATAGWLLMTLGFGIYTANFGNYNATYGALGAVVVLLMWLYLSAYVLLLGAELNAEMEHQTRKDTTTGPDRPMGARDAEMADTVGAATGTNGKKSR